MENEDEGIVQRDPRLFPIRTPQPPRRPQLYNSQYFDEHLGEFQRSSSLRSKTPQNDSKRQQDHQRDESMRRLLEWKQRMLQSPLSRKGSSVKLDSCSPKISHNSRVGRKSSSASRTSRARSLSRLSNRISSTSSSDEGKTFFEKN